MKRKGKDGVSGKNPQLKNENPEIKRRRP